MKNYFKSAVGFARHQYDKAYSSICKFNHLLRARQMRSNLINKEFTIISSDCTGGLIYHDLNMEFSSPTINMAINASGFVKLCTNLEWYMNDAEVVEDNSQKSMNGENYPILKVGDEVFLHGIHYHSTNQMMAKWNDRKTRVNYKNIFCIFTTKDGFEERILPEIDKVPYNKILLSNKQYDYDWCIYLPQTKNQETVGNVTIYEGLLGVRRYETHFDFIKWFNGEALSACKK